MIQNNTLPYLTRLLVDLALDGLEQEQEALQEIKAPKLDAFITETTSLRLVLRGKSVRAIAKHLKRETDNPYATEYELAYLNSIRTLRARIVKRDIEKLFLNIGEQ